MLSRFSWVQCFGTEWTVALQAPLSMGFSSQEYWSGLSHLPPRDLPVPGVEPESLHLLHCKGILYHWAAGEAPKKKIKQGYTAKESEFGTSNSYRYAAPLFMKNNM